MSDGHERVEVLGLRAYVIQETRSKLFWNLSQAHKYINVQAIIITYPENFKSKEKNLKKLNECD